ncbi:MAG TPA: hypothetical protein VLS89_04615 [Candidatus Nanopelagicales bacterium]|nr:hypothetical protein [Candidatus Nanopelagicales bacterium]
MRRRPIVHTLLILGLAATGGAAVAAGCSAVGERNEFTTTGPGTGGNGPGPGGGPGTGGEGGGIINLPDAGDAPPDVPMNPCGTGCGPEELCDINHQGSDDDCDGIVDEGCPCTAGQATACFMGDPSYRNTPGCFDGTQSCTENGNWGPCFGGVHATENCFDQDATGCHPIQAVPFQDVNLKVGTGNFSNNAVPGTEVWTVSCPAGVNPCPGVTGASPPDDYKPLQSGEYMVTYTKGVAGGGTETCSYPLFVGAPGLRVELEWTNPSGPYGADIDLHLHQPNNTQPWSTSGSPHDCGFANCTVGDFGLGSLNWFPANGVPPDPVKWYLDPVMEKNTCFYAPRGAGQQWQANGMGCHNPRLDIDNIYCDPGSSDPNDSSFCAPENINVDYPPIGEWFRVGVHHYSGSNNIYNRVKIYCNGALAADLGPTGYYMPENPVVFNTAGAGETYWLVADVRFQEGQCNTATCEVVPLYLDANLKTPFLTTETFVSTNFGPPYPP